MHFTDLNTSRISLAAAIIAAHFSIAPLLGQSSLRIPPDAPPGGVIDQAEIFDSTSEEKLTTKIQSAHKAEGLALFVATYDFVLDQSLEERAAALRDAWADDRHAIFLVFDRSSGSVSLVSSRNFEKTLSKEALQSVFQRTAAHVHARLRSIPQTDAPPDHAELIHLVVDALLTDPVLLESLRKPSPLELTPATRHLLAVFVVILILLGLIALLWERNQARAANQRRLRAHFPKTTVPNRLGGDFTGGVSGTWER